MARFEPPHAECFVFTEKEGLLSAVAHDLRLRVTAFHVEVDAGGAVQARFEAASLRVVCAQRGGVDDLGALSDKNRAEIEANLRKDVLAPERFPEIRFTAEGDASRAGHDRETLAGGGEVLLAGKLTLHGTTRPLSVRVGVRGEQLVVTAQLQQPDFGIKPYSAMFGTLKVKPTVRVQLFLPRASL